MGVIVDAIFGGGKRGAAEAAQITAAESARNRADTQQAIQLLQRSKLIDAGGIQTTLGAPVSAARIPAPGRIGRTGAGREFGLVGPSGTPQRVTPTTTGGALTVSVSDRRTALIDELSSTLSRTGREIGQLTAPSLTDVGLGELELGDISFPEFQPTEGFPELAGGISFPEFDEDIAFPDFPGNIFTSARANLSDIRRRTTGDLRENLARRRIAGSSFAADAVSRTQREFERQGLEIDAEEARQRLGFGERRAEFQAEQALQRLQSGERGAEFEAQQALDVLTSMERGTEFKAQQQRESLAAGERKADFETRQRTAEALFDFQTGIQNRNDLLREVDVRAQLIEREATFARASIETLINELNLETQVALQLTGIANAGIAGLTASTNSALAALAGTQAGIQFQAGVERDETIASLLGSAATIAGGV